MSALRTTSIIVLVAALLLALPILAAEPSTLTLEIKGMHCSGCAAGIEAMLKRVDGVTRVDVSYEKKQARVEYDPTRATSAKIIEAVETLGYQAVPKK